MPERERGDDPDQKGVQERVEVKANSKTLIYFWKET